MGSVNAAKVKTRNPDLRTSETFRPPAISVPFELEDEEDVVEQGQSVQGERRLADHPQLNVAAEIG